MSQTQSHQHQNSVHPRNWNTQALLADGDWKLQLGTGVIAEFAKALPRLPADPEQLSFAANMYPEMCALAKDIRDILFKRHGVCLVKGLADSPFTPEQHRLFYALLGMALGTPLLHYGLIYPIKDRGVDYTKTALPVSMTCAETEFHTDSSSIDANPDILSLLCEVASHNGGESQVSNGLNIYRRLQTEAPHVLDVLRKPFIRDIVTPGKEASPENLKKNSFPIYVDADDGRDIVFRYMRYWIERGHERAGQPLGKPELEALDTLDAYLKDPSQMASFYLEAGDMIYFDNKIVAHNRTSYKDTPGNNRLLWRMWIQA